MGAVGNDDHAPLLALPAGAVIGPGHQHPGQLAMRPGRGLETDRREPADFAQQLGEEPLELEAALAERGGIVRMGAGEARQAGRPFVQLGVVLHRARAERVEVDVDRVVQPAQAVEVADELELADLRQAGRLASAGRLGNGRLARRGRLGGGGWGREADRPSPGARTLEDGGLDHLQRLPRGRRVERGAASGGVGRGDRLDGAHGVDSRAPTRRETSSSVVSSVAARSSVSGRRGTRSRGRRRRRSPAPRGRRAVGPRRAGGRRPRSGRAR